MHQLLLNSAYHTSSPDEADLFYVTLLLRASTSVPGFLFCATMNLVCFVLCDMIVPFLDVNRSW